MIPEEDVISTIEQFKTISMRALETVRNIDYWIAYRGIVTDPMEWGTFLDLSAKMDYDSLGWANVVDDTDLEIVGMTVNRDKMTLSLSSSDDPSIRSEYTFPVKFLRGFLEEDVVEYFTRDTSDAFE